MGGHKELERDPAMTADPNWPKRPSMTIWCHAQCINPEGKVSGGWAAAQELAGHQSGGGEQLYCVSLSSVYSNIIIDVFPSFSVLSKFLYLNP